MRHDPGPGEKAASRKQRYRESDDRIAGEHDQWIEAFAVRMTKSINDIGKPGRAVPARLRGIAEGKPLRGQMKFRGVRRVGDSGSTTT
jgi:hypothetical protein